MTYIVRVYCLSAGC